MRALILLLMLVAFQYIAISREKTERYSRVKVYLDNAEHDIKHLSATGVAVDHGQSKKNAWFISDFSQSEIKRIKSAGFRVEVMIKDVSKFYRKKASQPAKTSYRTTTGPGCLPVAKPVPSQFSLGSYGGHFTYAEYLALLDTMRARYPGLISVRQAIDTFRTHENRPVYWVRISNRPDTAQPGKPQVLYTGVHHAREPGSLTSLIFFMWYMLENYSTDRRIKSIVDNAELYLIPCLNPDGYEYNIATNSSGGGLWRKNRRNNGSGIYGVDLNRNYGYFWGYDNVGSSPFSTSDTYRGPSAFSEPETRAIKWFCEQHNFTYALNYHSFGNDVIYPWGYTGSLLTPDSSQFQYCTDYMLEGTPYRHGTGDQTVGYVTNGASDDWLYGEQTTKNKIFGMTPEIGLADNGFYPPISEIIPDCQNNLGTSVRAAELLLPVVRIWSEDQRIVTSPTGYLHYNLQRLGMRDTTYTVTFRSLDSRLTISSSARTTSGLTLLQTKLDSVAYTITAGTPNSAPLLYERTCSNGLWDIKDTITLYNGVSYVRIKPSTDSLTGWVNTGWSVCSSNYHTAPASLSSSATSCAPYLDMTAATLQFNRTIDLTNAQEAFLYFYGMWGIEANYDYATVQASPEGSGSWNTLCGRYTKQGTASQLSLPSVYDGQQFTWIQEEMDLHDYIGMKVDIKFEMTSDAATNYSGLFIDDAEVVYTVNSRVSVNSINTPLQVDIYPNPAYNILKVAINGNPANATINIFDCTGRAALVHTMSSATEQLDISNLANGLYYVRVSGGDANATSKLMIQH